jgi:phospholipase C
VKPFHLDTTCEPIDPGHQWDEMHAQVNGGKMDGFVTSAAKTADPGPSDGHFAMGYYEESDVPFYYFLAKTYALADHHYPSVRSGTWANRDYLYCGTSDGVKNTLEGVPGPSVQTIFDIMDAQNVKWGVYADMAPLSLALIWPLDHRGVHPVQDLIDGFGSGDLPSVAFVDGRLNVEEDHPPADVQVGEAWVKKIYDAAVGSSLWNKTALIFTFDEGGGFFDHVPPPDDACIARPSNDKDTEFFELGVRVPLVAISPWSRRHTVSHVRHEHTSITRFIELLFDLPAMTKRDANSDALLDLFDFEQDITKPLPAPPNPGKGGCKTQKDGG